MTTTSTTRAASYLLTAEATRREIASVGGRMRVLVGKDDSQGLVSILEQRLDGPGGPPLHLHDDTDEVLMVIEGGPLTIQLGDKRMELERGGLLWAPRGTPHTFANLSGAPLRIISVVTPGGIEEVLHEQAIYLNGLAKSERPAIDRIVSIWGERGRIVGPPLPSVPSVVEVTSMT